MFKISSYLYSFAVRREDIYYLMISGIYESDDKFNPCSMDILKAIVTNLITLIAFRFHFIKFEFAFSILAQICDSFKSNRFWTN